MVSETTITHPPDADATDEDRARLLAADMARTGAIGEQQALVYAFRDVLGFGRRETAGALDKDPSTVDTALYAARDRISDADSLLRVLDAWGENGHGLDPRTVADWTPIEEFDGVRDSFGGATIHRRRDGVWRVGERYLFEDELVIVWPARSARPTTWTRRRGTNSGRSISTAGFRRGTLPMRSGLTGRSPTGGSCRSTYP
ncbi:hypothetical protein BRC80_05630 [Halobacteriales archaeon QH_9_66_26]|nr:MAG: hypothetical protein BRC80_05630 [Halobacteriales archaeon QH_9_66_26]